MNLLRIIPITAAVLFTIAVIPAHAQKEEKERPPQQHTEQAPQGKSQSQQPQQHEQRAQQPRERQHAQQPVAPGQRSQPQHAQEAKPSPVSQPRHSQPATHQEARTPQHDARPSVSARVRAPQIHRSEQQARSWQQERGWAKQGGAWQAHINFQQSRDHNWASDHRNWTQRGGYGGYYIPQTSFGARFGSAHYFRIGAMPVMYMGYPRFAYGGYSFMLLDPWPDSWRGDWYASDDVYIDYSDGYYLHNRRYPGVTLAVSVVL